MTRLALTGMLIVAAAIATPTTMPAQDVDQGVTLAVRPESRLWIEGSSNVHEWSCKATKLDAAIVVNGGWEAAMQRDVIDLTTMLKRVEVKVDVASLKCGKDKMDELMYKALKAGDAPGGRYILGSFETEPAAAKDSFVVRTVGTLRIAGKENPVRMDVRAERLPDGSLRARSELPILMTDYGVKPPTALLGTLRTKDKVTVKFELLVGPNTMIAAAGK